MESAKQTTAQLMVQNNPALKPRLQVLQGMGQITLVEHALCPLHKSTSLVENLIHQAAFSFTDQHRHRQQGNAHVHCPAGLSAGDEYYLWGLLALTFDQPTPEMELRATRHYCLRRLGLIDQHTRRGGRQYQQFVDAIERLSVVTYRNDGFYDPIRREHRKVSFGFLSYSLPLDPNSNRAWRIAWDPIFFEFVQAHGGHFCFDLATYRRLDHASRRPFLLLCKIFYRRKTSPKFDVRQLAVHVLGFAPTISTRQLKQKVARCIQVLLNEHVLASNKSVGIFEKSTAGRYTVTLERGRYFVEIKRKGNNRGRDSALFDVLKQLGFSVTMARNLIATYPTRLLQEWADITMAAEERFGTRFFKRSREAYFIDNIRNAAQGARTPPDWWLDLRKQETRRQATKDRQKRPSRDTAAGNASYSGSKFKQEIEQEMYVFFQAAGQSEESARQNAHRFAKEQKRRCQPEN